MGSSNPSLDRARGAVAIAALAIVTILTRVGPFGGWRWGRPEVLFSLVTVSAVGCVIAATVLIAVADRREQAELGLLGTMLMAASVFPLVHGLVTPGVLFDVTEAFRTSSFMAMPVALAVGSPLLAPHSAFGRWAARHWRDWTLLALLGVFVAATTVVFFPEMIVAPEPTGRVAIATTAIVAAAVVALSMRQMRLYGLGRRPANLVAAVSLALLGVMACSPLSSEPYDLMFWWTHLAGAVGVIGACFGLAVTTRLSPAGREVLAPILSRDPLSAFELGLSPVVHAFVAEIETEDVATRDHVARIGELAMRVGEQFQLSASELRDLGLAALLHDVGKVNVPDSILRKPDRLTDDEYDLMKQHPVDGAAMLATERSLESAARIVRSHHERFDGRGYPDGLVGRDIPLASRIIAACDALDAMTHDRQYRRAMPTDLAFAILREHSGSQWDDEVVRRVITVASTVPALYVFDDVGRRGALSSVSIPDDVGELLMTVDAEI